MPRWLLIMLAVAGSGAVLLGVLLSTADAPRAATDPMPPPAIAVPASALAATPDAAAPEPDREARRLARYDKDDDGQVSREEFLAARRKAYAKLDVDGDGRLSFEEFAVKTIDKFATADANRDARLTAAEFATTAKKRTVPKKECPEPAADASDA